MSANCNQETLLYRPSNEPASYLYLRFVAHIGEFHRKP